MDQALAKVFLPEGVLDFFTLTTIEAKEDSFLIRLEEKNSHPSEYSGQKLVSKGFHDPITIKDFPIRGKACFL